MTRKPRLTLQQHLELGWELAAMCDAIQTRFITVANEALGLEPGECVFIDDDPDLVAAALKLGYQGRWMQRAGSDRVDAAVPAVTSLAELIELF